MNAYGAYAPENNLFYPIMARKNTIRLLLGLLALLFIVALAIAWPFYRRIYVEGVPEKLDNPFVHIPTGSSYDDVVYILKNGGYITDEASFRWVAEEMKYSKPVMRSGRFEIKPGWSNRELIQHLRAGEQSPVKLVLNMERLPEDVAGKAARFLESDSLALLKTFRDPEVLQELGYTPETLIAMFIPNTYEMFWNTDPKSFLKRMKKENESFWAKNGRLEKAKALGLSPVEVYTLASIVDRESNVNEEKPRIAGVYLNRLRVGMRLQADPTSVFATRDFGATRVTDYHTTFDSPYNTYVYYGLPPGPISMASIPGLEAVLNPEQHDYIFFCAKPDDSGAHAFAVTYAAHLVNVDKFKAYLAKRGN